MNKMLVAVFDNEANAHEGLTELRSLHRSGDISMYASAVISKDNSGKLYIKSSDDEGPVGAVTGLAAGSMIGLLGGPAGFAIGAVAGSLLGLLFDADHEDVNIEFINDVSNALSNGKTAIVAEIDEDWTIPIDKRLKPLNAMVFRRYRYEVIDERLERESKAIADEFRALTDELEQAGEEERAVIRAEIELLKSKANATGAMLDNKISSIEKELDGKVTAMQAQISEANEKRKAKLQSKLNSVKADYSMRTSKLKRASALIKEALSVKSGSVRTPALSA